MRAPSSFASVVPRAVAPVSGESLPLTDIIFDQIDSNTRTIQITGHGKSTALSHLAAEFFGKREIQFLDEEVPSAPSDRALTVFACQIPNPTADLTIQLCEWGIDEVIEYLMTKCPSRCKSVMTRLGKSNDLWLGDGAPDVLVPVLDMMIETDQYQDFESALVAHFDSLDITNDARKHIESYFTKALLNEEHANAFLYSLSPKFIDRSTFKLLIHQPVRFALSKSRLIKSLESQKTPEQLKIPWPLEFVNLVAKSIKENSVVQNFLNKEANRPQSNISSNCASLLAAIDKNWRPTHDGDLAFYGSHLQNVNWSGVVAERFYMTHADLSGADLRRTLMQAAKLTNANLSFANLTGANISSAVATDADLTGAKLRVVNAEHASFQSANLASVDASHGNFQSARLNEAILKDANFSKANLRMTDLLHAVVAGANFKEADLSSAKMNELDLRFTELDGAQLIQTLLAHCNFAGMRLTGTLMNGAKLSGAIMTASHFRNVSMQNCLFTNAKLADVDWEGCDLRKSNFTNTHFHMGSTRSGLVGSTYPSHGTRTGFYTDDFDEQHFKSPEEIRKANLRGCDLRGAGVAGSDFYLVDLRDAKYDDEQRKHFERCNAILTGWEH